MNKDALAKTDVTSSITKAGLNDIDAINLYLSFGFEFVGKVFFDFKAPGQEWYDCYEKLITLSK